MPGDPKRCRLNATRCLRLAGLASNPERRGRLSALAETWRKLAAQTEADQALLDTLSNLDFDAPYDALPLALHLKAA
jgi:hypothetical protein